MASTPSKHITVFTLAASPIGDVVIVKTRVPLNATDGDYSMEVAAGERLLRSRYFTVHGSFLETDPAARLVNLDACTLIE